MTWALTTLRLRECQTREGRGHPNHSISGLQALAQSLLLTDGRVLVH